MIRRLLILLVILTASYAQKVHLGKVHLGKVTFGTTGSAPPPPLTDSIGAEWWAGPQPIGGGPWYSDSFTISSGNGTTHYYVSTYAHFNAIIQDSCDGGDTIYIADGAQINFTNNEYILYGSALSGRCDSLTICSGRGRVLGDTVSWGGLLYTTDKTIDEMIRVYAPRVRFSGLRIKGPVAYYYLGTTSTYETFAAITYYWSGGRVDNCEFINCGYAGLSFGSGATACSTQYNYFHHNKFYGCGYGITIGSTAVLAARANLFDHYRHAIAAAGDNTGYYDASYNVLLEHDAEWQSMDRHIGGAGGDIFRNTFQSWQQQGNAVTAFRLQSGIPTDSLLITNNWVFHNDSTEAWQLATNTNVRISQTHYGRTLPDGLSARIPTANGQIDTDSGQIPLLVTMKEESSTGRGLGKWSEWDFGIGDVVERTRADSTQHSYAAIGQYHPRYYVHDSLGCVDYDEFTVKAVPVTAKQDSFWLSFWYLDTYADAALSGDLEAQVLIDNDTIWNQDIKGDSVWQHKVLNVTSEVGANDSVTLELRLVYKDNSNGAFPSIAVIFDDIWGWNLTIRNGDFELDANGVNQAPTYWTANHVSAGGGYVGWYQATSDVVSGEMSWLMKTTENGYGQANDYVYCRQEIDVVGQ